MAIALAGAIVLGVLSTFYDFLWAHFEVRHKAINGIVHGMTLLSVAGVVLAWPTGRWLPGLIGGAVAGLIGAVSFYAAYPLLGYLNALVAAWVIMWIAFSTLETQLRRVRVGTETAIRGLAAAALSGVAFYLVSGMWTDHSAPPNYLRNFASWAFAFFPGFAALLWGRASALRSQR
jgi:hypothetical protein